MKRIATLILASLAFVPLLSHAAFDACLDYFPGKVVPQVQSRAKLKDLCFDSFAVLYSGESKTAVYSVEKLNRARLTAAKGEQRTDSFYPEARLPSAYRATLADYRGSGFDRGHVSPAGDMPNENAMAQSFSLANMVPQAPANNRGIWAKKVEAATRQYTMRAKGDVYVFTGPVYSGQVRTIGTSQVWVPTYLFKLVYDQADNKAWAYWVDNTDEATMTKPISYQALTARLGFSLLPHPVD